MRDVGQETSLSRQHPGQLLVGPGLRLDRAVHAIDHRQHDQRQRRRHRSLDRKYGDAHATGGERQRRGPCRPRALPQEREVRPAAVQRRRYDRKAQVDRDINEGRRRRADDLLDVDVGAKRPAHERGDGGAHQRVTRVDRGLRPRPAHEAVAQDDAQRGRGGSDRRREEQRRHYARQRAEVHLLLGADLDRVLLRQDHAGGAGRDDEPAPWLGGAEATQSGGQRRQRNARHRDADDDGLQRPGKGPEGRSGRPQVRGTSR